MKKITDVESMRNVNGGGIISSFIIGFVLKRKIMGPMNKNFPSETAISPSKMSLSAMETDS